MRQVMDMNRHFVMVSVNGVTERRKIMFPQFFRMFGGPCVYAYHGMLL